MLPDTADLFEYEHYLKNQTRENASEFISIALENNLDLIGKRKNFVDYIANRPKVEKLGTHGLFTDDGVPVVLSQVAEEVSSHSGNVWTNIISLRRGDAAKLGYDSAKQWQDLIRGQRNVIAENMKIALERRNVLSNQSHEIMQDIISPINSGICENKNIEELITHLAEKLKHTFGKKQYGYLKAPLKAVINQIVDELAKDERAAKLYSSWYEMRNEVLSIYADRYRCLFCCRSKRNSRTLKIW